MKRARRWPAAWLALLVSVASCSQEEPAMPAEDPSDWLEQVERAHAIADKAAPAEAAAALREVLALAEPEMTQWHRALVYRDLWFRLASVENAAGHFDEALRAADSGLKLDPMTDVFTANLHIARGEALEGLGRDAEAASAYFEALEINRKLLHDALPAKDAGLP